jgi:urease accessory protein
MKDDVHKPTAAMKRDGIFAANRSKGEIKLAVGVTDGMSLRRRVAESGPLRVRFPTPDADDLEAVVVNTAGGIAGGDRHRLDISVQENAQLTVTTAAAEKIYRALGPDAEIEIELKVAAGARLSWLPQETILFDRCRLSRRIDVELGGNATLIMAEMVVFGRSAMGEAVDTGSFRDRWRVRRDGRLLFAETVKLDGAVAEKLAEPAVAAGGVAVATVLLVPGDDDMIARVRAVRDQFMAEVGISAWNGIALARLCAKDGASVRHDLACVLTALGASLPRIWLN